MIINSLSASARDNDINHELEAEIEKMFFITDPSLLLSEVESKEELLKRQQDDDARKSNGFCYPDALTYACMAVGTTLADKISSSEECMRTAIEMITAKRKSILALNNIYPSPLVISTAVYQAKLGDGKLDINKDNLMKKMKKISSFLKQMDSEHVVTFNHTSCMNNVVMTLFFVPKHLLPKDADYDVACQLTSKCNKKKRKKTGDANADRKNVKAVLVFTNGKLTVTGCVGMQECFKFASLTSKIMEHALEVHNMSVTNVETSNINTDFFLEHRTGGRMRLHLEKVKDSLKKMANQNIKVLLDIERRHPGVQIKFGASTTRIVTIILFHSGHVIIMGCTKGAELRDAYAFVMDFLDSHIHVINRVPDVLEMGGNTTSSKKRASKNSKQAPTSNPDLEIDFLSMLDQL